MEQPGFLKIPTELRARILRSVGVPSDSKFHLNQSSFERRPPRAPLSATHALLLTCRRLNTEVSELLYSDNLFLLNLVDAEDFQLLSALRPETVRLLKRLTVHVNALSGLPDEGCEGDFRGGFTTYYGKLSSKPLSLRADDQDILDGWQAAIRHVLEHAAPHRLHLHVVCDCEDVKTARHITVPILQAGKPLADCALRLSRDHIPALAHEARTTARQAMFMTDEEPCFPFMRLPAELQRQVLEFTDLVTPLRDVEWAPRMGYFFRCTWGKCDPNDSKWACGKFHHACRYVNCWQAQKDGCFCSRFHSAYSRVCHCWIPPTSHFCVSHAFGKTAKAVFFSQNRFLVKSRRGFDKSAKLTPARIAPSIFIDSHVDVLKYITYLELVFPPIDYDYLRADHPAYVKWLNSIELAVAAFNVPHLTLYVTMAEPEATGCYLTHFQHNVTPSQSATIIEMYFRIIGPLARLRRQGLRRFFVSLAWPFEWTDSGNQRRRINSSAVDREVEELERNVERAVMGDGYDSIAAGKLTTPRMQWTHRFEEGMDMFLRSVENSETESDLDE